MMKNQILSVLMSAAMLAGTASIALADTDTTVAPAEATDAVVLTEAAENAEALADATPKVFVNSTEVYFYDQQPVIKDDFTLVPVRGVFEAMNNKVKWDGETQTVTINSQNNMTRVVLTIGSETMFVYHFTSIMNADETKVTLDVAPQIMNDRTMIPLRAISEALGTDVAWDGEKYEVHITTKDFDAEDTKKLTLSLSADKTTVKAGEDLVLSAELKNLDLYPNMYVSAVTASVSYNKDNFELVKVYLCGSNGEEVAGAMGADNPDYTEDSLKTVYITIDSEKALKADGAALKMIFKAKNDSESSFALADRYNSKLGNDVTVLLGGEDNKTKMVEGTNLIIDTTPVTVNSAAPSSADDEQPADENLSDNTEETIPEENSSDEVPEIIPEEETSEEE